jgi:hypothetical protein
MGHMQIETRLTTWVEVDAYSGTTFIPADVFSADEGKAIHDFIDGESDELTEEVRDALDAYVEGGGESVRSVSVRGGWGARLSAPGYLDCTEWSVFDTEEEARESVAEMYGEDEEDEEDEEEEDDSPAMLTAKELAERPDPVPTVPDDYDADFGENDSNGQA